MHDDITHKNITALVPNIHISTYVLMYRICKGKKYSFWIMDFVYHFDLTLVLMNFYRRVFFGVHSNNDKIHFIY